MTTTTTPRKKTPFETKPCGRCGGSGRYSYCQMYGDRCFGCSGSGLALTKRGAAAREMFLASLERTYGEVEIGWRVLVSGRGWLAVTGVDLNPGGGSYENYGTPEEVLIPNTHGIVTGTGDGRVTMVGMADSRITGYADRAEYDANLHAALDYQETLTKAGTPRKR